MAGAWLATRKHESLLVITPPARNIFTTARNLIHIPYILQAGFPPHFNTVSALKLVGRLAAEMLKVCFVVSK